MSQLLKAILGDNRGFQQARNEQLLDLGCWFAFFGETRVDFAAIPLTTFPKQFAVTNNNGTYDGADSQSRCWWCEGHDDYQQYHDDEWGVPVEDDQRLFEKICLEGFQSGLSWLTILRKRENFRKAFADFDFQKIARFRESHVERLLQNAGIIRHRGKIEATINNAARAIEMVNEYGSLAAWFWEFEPPSGEFSMLQNKTQASERTTIPQAIRMSKELKKKGWKFVGPTTAYAFMQAMGMVNDHLVSCHRHTLVEQARSQFVRPA